MSKQSHLKKYDVILMKEDVSQEDINTQRKIWPTDVHIISFIEEGQTKCDAIRSYKMSDIFDGYYDFGVKDINYIKSGYGNIKPKLYNPTKEGDS